MFSLKKFFFKPVHLAFAIVALAGSAFADGNAATLRISKQDRPSFDEQLKGEVAKLREQAQRLDAAGDKKSKKEAADCKKEADRLEQSEIPNLAPREISVRNTIEQWNAAETAIIICDMWNQHWCKHATARVAELAPAMNEVLTIARGKGVKIIHAPSETLNTYKNHPARKRALAYSKNVKNSWAGKLATENGAPWPVDAVRGGCPECKTYYPWKSQIATLPIKNEDFISDNGAEVFGYLKDKGVKNVILMGVHTNMCIVGCPFGLRAMRHAGFNAALMRDMTDLSYNNVIGRETGPGTGSPHVNHFSGLDLVVEYIETYIAPTLVSSDFTGRKQFRFKEDTRPASSLSCPKTNTTPTNASPDLPVNSPSNTTAPTSPPASPK